MLDKDLLAKVAVAADPNEQFVEARQTYLDFDPVLVTPLSNQKSPIKTRFVTLLRILAQFLFRPSRKAVALGN